jgi:hypothetical protein
MQSDTIKHDIMRTNTIIFLFLNSSMMHERPTSWPAPLHREREKGGGGGGEEGEKEREGERGREGEGKGEGREMIESHLPHQLTTHNGLMVS